MHVKSLSGQTLEENKLTTLSSAVTLRTAKLPSPLQNEMRGKNEWRIWK